VIARRVARMTADILGPGGSQISIAPRISEAREAIQRDAPELLILDLNLEGDDGFELLKELSAHSFDTIVISAHRERALEAFEYGVRDFIAKPFTRERLEQALRRVLAPATRSERPIEHLGVRREGVVEFIAVEKVMFIRGAGTRSELVLAGGRTALHDKLLDRLEGVLPARFERIHKSYIVDLTRVRRLVAQEGSRYSVELVDGTVLPVGRTRVTALRSRLG
jgi:two-component system response regulator LytT